MTLDGARSTARGMAERFGKAFVIWRMAAWPTDCWGVIAKERELPDAADVLETWEPGMAEQPKKLEEPEQGGLF